MGTTIATFEKVIYNLTKEVGNGVVDLEKTAMLKDIVEAYKHYITAVKINNS